jgi:RNA polymerase sigma factor (TIGR02999 family)
MTNAEVTLLLDAMARGDQEAHERLVPVIERRLHELAEARMRRERPDHTLQPTELVNEAYIRLAGGGQAWENRAHFYGAAAEAMRRVLIDHARRRAAEKRGGGVEQVTFHDLNVAVEEPEIDLFGLDEALQALGEVDGRLAQVVRLRYFAGFGIEEVAEILGVSPATVKRDWTYARAWLLERMRGP